jgi:hypothetical protein
MTVAAERGLVIVLSGHTCRPYSADLRPFWNGFIELQRKLPSHVNIQGIFVHSWNPEYSDLVDLVYAPRSPLHEEQSCFYPEFINDINPPEIFEQGLNRPQSTWRSVSVQTVLGNARSRARAVALIDFRLPEMSESIVLMTRWDLGQTGSAQVNQLVVDLTLPDDCLYLSYYPEVDEGYADMWIVGSSRLVERFSRFDHFCWLCITGHNDYLEMFTKSGWPRARQRFLIESMMLHAIGQLLASKALTAIRVAREKCVGNGFFQRALRKILRACQKRLASPPVTAENSCVPNLRRRVFPTYQALNIHALLKYFILTEGMREKTRFLTAEDFDLSAQSGHLINPQALILFCWQDAFMDESALGDLFGQSPLPLRAVYFLGDNGTQEVYRDENGQIIIRNAQTTMSKKEQLVCAMEIGMKRSWRNLPLLLLPSVDSYQRCADWFYLNALLKYIAWSGTDYVGLSSVAIGTPYLGFPNTELVRGLGAFSLTQAAGTLRCIHSLLERANSLEELTLRAERMALEFICVSQSRRLF